eukprot:SAG31_NODE_4034_length_3647_cov_26.004510_3_plen_176_part_00
MTSTLAMAVGHFCTLRGATVATSLLISAPASTSLSSTYAPHSQHFEAQELAETLVGNISEVISCRTEIDSGKYRPVELQAGSVVFRVPQCVVFFSLLGAMRVQNQVFLVRVWHASVPIGRLRRYITGDYRRRTRLSVACREYINRVVETRQPADISTIPPAVQPLWTWSGETASL